MFNPYMNQQNGMNGAFQNPYLERLGGLQAAQMGQAQHRYEITRVNGRGGAEAFQMPPNSAYLLLDETAPIVWLKQTDGGGYPTLTPYSITPYQAAPEPDFSSLESRIQKLEAIINGKSDSAKSGAAGPADGTGSNVVGK